MDRTELLNKAESEEGLTAEEVLEYQATIKPVVHTYGKYGTLAKQYLEEYNQGKLWALAGDLPKYLHGIDEQAEDLYETMSESLSRKAEYKMTGDYISDLRKKTQMHEIINEEILNQIVYEKD